MSGRFQGQSDTALLQLANWIRLPLGAQLAAISVLIFLFSPPPFFDPLSSTFLIEGVIESKNLFSES